MLRPTRAALGALGALGALACSDKSATAPETDDLRLRAAAIAASGAAVGPLTTPLADNVCADVYQASRSAGARLIMWSCHGGANQQFAWQPTGEVTVYGDKCMDAATGNGRDGDAIIIWWCHGGANQKWRVTNAGEIRGINDKCVTLDGGRPSNGASLSIRSCNGSASQRWEAPSVAGNAPPNPAPATGDASSDDEDSSDQDEPEHVASPNVSAPPTSNAPSAGVAAPELPRTYVNTALVAPTGKTVTVRAGDNLQKAIDAARPGDVLLLQAGATFIGNFTLPEKSGSDWITIRSSASDASLPAAGTRATPRFASAMPKIVSPNVMPALATEPSAHHYRLIGLEITTRPHQGYAYNIIELGSEGKAQRTLSRVPHNLILDRLYVHGGASLDIRRCVALNSAMTAIIDSWLADCHGRGFDSQAILGWNGPGPFKIVNNHLEGAGENIMFGGSDPAIPNLVPSDIEIRRNYVYKPMSWKGRWSVKNLFELKNARRVLVEGNVFENNWADAQTGFAILMKSVNQDGSAPWSQTSDVTFQYNIVRRVSGGISLAGRPESSPAIRLARVRIAHNVLEQVGDVSLGSGFNNGRLYQIETSDAVELAHNSGVGTTHGLLLIGASATSGFVMRDNFVDGGPGITSADGKGVGSQGLTFHVPGWRVAGNVIGTNYPAHAYTLFPGGNSYTRNGSTAGATATTTDGLPVGADRGAVAQKTAGVVVAP